jgi:hypothetical protein
MRLFTEKLRKIKTTTKSKKKKEERIRENGRMSVKKIHSNDPILYNLQ